MSELTDHLGLTGEQRRKIERSWMHWRYVLGLDDEAMRTFRRMMTERSTSLSQGGPPGHRHGNRSSYTCISMAIMLDNQREIEHYPPSDLTDEESFDLAERVRQAWRAAWDPSIPASIFSAHSLGRSKDGSIWVQSTLVVPRHLGEGIHAEDVELGWRGFFDILGIPEGDRGVLQDFFFENSQMLVDGVLPPDLNDNPFDTKIEGSDAEVFRRAARRMSKGNPRVLIRPSAIVTPYDGWARFRAAKPEEALAKVMAWWRIDL